MEEGGWNKCFRFFFSPVFSGDEKKGPLFAVQLCQHLRMGDGHLIIL